MGRGLLKIKDVVDDGQSTVPAPAPNWARKCAECGFDEATDPARQVYECDGCGKYVCTECSQDGPSNSVICDDCGDRYREQLRADAVEINDQRKLLAAELRVARRPRAARFKVYGPIDGAEGCTVKIDRASGVMSVRPLRRKRVYELPLIDVATMVLHTIVKGETLRKQAEKKRGRKFRRRRL